MNKILIIEDEGDIRDMFVEALVEEGFRAIGAKNGQVGIEKTQKYHPDLIICDVTMPDLDGYQILTTLRQIPSTATIPFIFMSALSDEAERHKAMQLGADDYLSKPCTVEQLLEAITKFACQHTQKPV